MKADGYQAVRDADLTPKKRVHGIWQSRRRA